jgi:hypothetical protein
LTTTALAALAATAALAAFTTTWATTGIATRTACRAGTASRDRAEQLRVLGLERVALLGLAEAIEQAELLLGSFLGEFVLGGLGEELLVEGGRLFEPCRRSPLPARRRALVRQAAAPVRAGWKRYGSSS